MIETKDLILKQGSADDGLTAQDLYRNLWSRGEVFRYMFTKPSPTEEHAILDLREGIDYGYKKILV